MFILFLLPILCFANESGDCGIYASYLYEDNTQTLTISGSGSMWDYYNSSNIPWYKYKDKIKKIIINEGIEYIGETSFLHCETAESVEIPKSVKTVGQQAFFGCLGLQAVYIKDLKSYLDISYVKSSYFSNPLTYAHHLYLDGLEVKEITFPESMTKIKDCVLSGGSEISSITLPSTIKSIGDYSFLECKAITSIKLPSSISTIGVASFEGCSGLKSIELPNCLELINKSLFAGCSSLIKISIPENVSTIENNAFANCCGLISVEIPNKVTIIKYDAFRECSALESINIPNSVIKIENQVFQYCKGLKSVNLPDGLKSIGSNCFDGCSNLSSIRIPDGVEKIERNTFMGCNNLVKVEIGTNVKTIGDFAFLNCNNIKSLDIPDGVTEIGKNAFDGCASLLTLSLSKELKIISTSAFWGCSALKEIILPEKLEYIYADAFTYCQFNKVTSLSATPPYAHENAFPDYNIPLYVPLESINSYQETSPWNKFKELKSTSGENTEFKCKKPTIKYSKGLLTFECETSDVVFMSKIKDDDIRDYSLDKVQLGVTYNISVYATKEGYNNSDVATATLCWIDQQPTTEGITNGIANVPARAIMIQSEGGMITVSGANEGEHISIYEANGQQAGATICQNGASTIATTIPTGSIAIVKVGEKSVKVIMK